MDGPPTDTDPASPDPIGAAVVDALGDLLVGVDIDLSYHPTGSVLPPDESYVAVATADGPPGRRARAVVHLDERLGHLVATDERGSLRELLEALPSTAVAVAARFRDAFEAEPPPVGASLRRALRDEVAAEILATHLRSRLATDAGAELLAETLEYLMELGSTRVEARDLTHGVIITGLWPDPPRLQFRYPADLRYAKRAPLLFDGQRSVLVVDPAGRARREIRTEEIRELVTDPTVKVRRRGMPADTGLLVARATELFGGVGFFLRADSTIWSFVDGQPLLVRRGEHWAAFPLRLAASVASLIDGGDAATLVARTALVISGQVHGAILAVVDSPDDLDGVVPLKDRYDLRHQTDPTAMRPETRLHHLIDVDVLDEDNLARLATLDGATIVDRDGNLLAYGAIVTATDSQHEGARTAAARTLSQTALVVLKISSDGDITIFRDGQLLTTLLPSPSDQRS